MWSSSSALPGPVSQAISVSVAVDIGDVGDAADINHDDRPLALQRLGQRAVIDRHERRALPAGGDVGGAEIMHDGNMDRLGQAAASPICTVNPALGPVQHGLAVKADDVDVLGGDAVLRGKGGDRLGMGQGDGRSASRRMPGRASRCGRLTASYSAWRSRRRSISL